MNVPRGGPLHGSPSSSIRGAFFMKVSDPRRGAIRGSFRSLGLAAAAMLLLAAATGQRAEALSLINPGAVPSAKYCLGRTDD